LAKSRSLPEYLVSDDDPKFRSAVMFRCAQDIKVEFSFIAPDKPQQNAFVESLNGKLRKKCLDLDCLGDLIEIRDVINNWRIDYNVNRPHVS